MNDECTLKLGKKKKSRSKFAEAIDPRFTGIFQNSSSSVTETKTFSQNGSGSQREQVSDGDQGFRDFLSKKLYEHLDKHIKVVDNPVENYDLFQFEVGDICLFSDSDILSEDLIKTTETIPPKKKKRKKERNNEKELFKQVAVTADWIQRQAQIYNS